MTRQTFGHWEENNAGAASREQPRHHTATGKGRSQGAWIGRRLLLLPLAAALAAAGGCSAGELADRVSAGGFPASPVPSVSPGTDASVTSPMPAGSPDPSAVPATPSPSPRPTASPSPKPHVNPAPAPGNNVADSVYGQGKPSVAGLAKPNDGRQHTAKVAKGTRAVALTFDDGPDGRTTPAILDMLKKNDIKATFFVVGTQVKQYPDVVARIVKEGHALGNHTYHHADLAKTGRTKTLQEIAYNDTLIERATGIIPSLFRPPYGSTSPQLKQLLRDSGRSMELWNVDTRDWAGTSVATMRANVNRNVKPGSVILMHSFGSKLHTAELLPLIIKDLKNKGYVFVTVDELPEA
ncbi:MULTISPECIES: polysaccharide deacetylase family protein [unclassified Paenibacillus]|uniref:polysaccharide deacetylase family protein n=1 Tax=unclassified Paenibacillus TaxID=185978 RepID=UPI0009563F50|nr:MULTISPECIES: polysaccharide deacetylase family protein [unclassified Paenibacillus]ASS67011.2 polysaccharide deacetylase family protein [Paenibacillus sp. RUD330]SIR49027.1 Peptidoglycan/xylan/chitin deacetylase, PgdA/CDA1 family [Paenibacillus sp. RU4X]SIR58302.1 Peptidoglycan/xylan/chitin deacetylase, PgdA/CDA1 family [Paenibacillus sp. RU4T]